VDACRTFRVSETSRAQQGAWKEVVDAIRFVENTVVPGYSCRKLYQDVKGRLDRVRPGSFFHHLGHGIGLAPHERPSLNPHWNQVFEEGDVFTIEPGLYAEDLAAGIRLEEIYHLTKSGIEKLTRFPLGL
jgi:Xaa-Pro aminopeptidase